MPEHSRRTFLATAGVAAVGAGAAASAAGPAVAISGASHVDETATVEDDVRVGTIVAYVKDVASGEITVMADGRETVFTDRAVARALALKVG